MTDANLNARSLEALEQARTAILAFHGPTDWELYESHAPEMLLIDTTRQALREALGHEDEPPPRPEKSDEAASIERWGFVQGERSVKGSVETAMDDLERRAIKALSDGDYATFGCCADNWQVLNKAAGVNFPPLPPFRALIETARALLEGCFDEEE